MSITTVSQPHVVLHNPIRTVGSGLIAAELSEGVWSLHLAPQIIQPAAFDLYPHEDGTISVDASSVEIEE